MENEPKSNTSNIVITIIVIILLGVGAYFVFNGGKSTTTNQPAAAVVVPEDPGMITAPVSNATVSGTITVSATAPAAHVPAISKAELSVDGTIVGTKTGTTPSYNFPLNTKTLTKGMHTLTVTFTDDSNNILTTPAVTINVDNTAVSTGVNLGLDK